MMSHPEAGNTSVTIPRPEGTNEWYQDCCHFMGEALGQETQLFPVEGSTEGKWKNKYKHFCSSGLLPVLPIGWILLGYREQGVLPTEHSSRDKELENDQVTVWKMGYRAKGIEGLKWGGNCWNDEGLHLKVTPEINFLRRVY